MKKKTKRLLIALQFLTLFMLVVMFAFSVYARHVAEGFTNSPNPDYDSKLRGEIGEEYTSNMHARVVGALNSSDSANHSLARAMYSGASAGISIVGVAAFLNMLSMFHLFRQSSEE